MTNTNTHNLDSLTGLALTTAEKARLASAELLAARVAVLDDIARICTPLLAEVGDEIMVHDTSTCGKRTYQCVEYSLVRRSIGVIWERWETAPKDYRDDTGHAWDRVPNAALNTADMATHLHDVPAQEILSTVLREVQQRITLDQEVTTRMTEEVAVLRRIHDELASQTQAESE